MVKSLGINSFDCRNFENPVLQSFYANLQSIALNEQPEPIEDLLQPDSEGINKYCGEVISNFKYANYGNRYAAPKLMKGKKVPKPRKRPQAPLKANHKLSAPKKKIKKQAEN